MGLALQFTEIRDEIHGIALSGVDMIHGKILWKLIQGFSVG